MILVIRWLLVAFSLIAAGAADRGARTGDFVFEIRPRVIAAGETAVLRWSVKDATKVLIEELPQSEVNLKRLGVFGPSGSIEVRPTENTTYVISCEGTTRTRCASASVRVQVRRR